MQGHLGSTEVNLTKSTKTVYHTWSEDLQTRVKCIAGVKGHARVISCQPEVNFLKFGQKDLQLKLVGIFWKKTNQEPRTVDPNAKHCLCQSIRCHMCSILINKNKTWVNYMKSSTPSYLRSQRLLSKLSSRTKQFLFRCAPLSLVTLASGSTCAAVVFFLTPDRPSRLRRGTWVKKRSSLSFRTKLTYTASPSAWGILSFFLLRPFFDLSHFGQLLISCLVHLIDTSMLRLYQGSVETTRVGSTTI